MTFTGPQALALASAIGDAIELAKAVLHTGKVRRMTQKEILYIDEGDNADWIKGRTWELPRRWSSFYITIGGTPEALREFMKLRAALAMPDDLRARAQQVLDGKAEALDVEPT
jgi:hypothetical protein